MSGKKKGLGRGLSALFGDEKPIEKPQEQKPEVGLSNVQTTEIPGGMIQIG